MGLIDRIRTRRKNRNSGSGLITQAKPRLATNVIAEDITNRASTRRARRARKNPTNVSTSTVVQIRKPIVRRPQENIVYGNDTLNVAEYQISNEEFDLIEKNGISNFRPEIISLTDYMPVFDSKGIGSGEFNTVGKYIDFQYQTLMLRRDTLVEMLAAIEEWSPEDVDKTTKAMTIEFRKTMDKTQRTLDFYKNYVGTVEKVKNLVDIKNAYGNRQIGRDRFFYNSDFQGFFEKYLQYPKNQFNSFSNSKIYLQFINDLRSIIENYSYSLLNLTDFDRANDFNPIDIDNSYTLKDGFSFSIDTLRSPTAPKNFTQSSFFNAFLNSLPNNKDDRTKLLITVLSKELRISKNLADASIKKTLSDKFGNSPGTGGDGTGNPFDNILGIAGDTIFDLPIGDNSLASLAYMGYDDNTAILPFENKYIDFNGSNKKSFVPGSNYFIDNILNVDVSNNTVAFDTKPFLDYISMVSEYTSDATSAIRKLLELDSPKTVLDPETVFNKLLEVLKASTSSLATSRPEREQSFALALIKLANTDNFLKSCLFQFLCLAGVYSLSAKDDKTIFRQFANELQTTQGLSNITKITAASLLDNKQLYPHLENLAQTIASRVISLVSKNSTDQQLNVSVIIQKTSGHGGKQTTKIEIKNKPEDSNSFLVTASEITEILMGAINSQSIASTNILKSFLDLSNVLSNNAMEKTQGYLLSDGSGRTRYNFISTSAQLLILFEIISSFSDSYSYSTLVKTNASQHIGVITKYEETKFIKDIIQKTLDASKNKIPAVSAPISPAQAIANAVAKSLSVAMVNNNKAKHGGTAKRAEGQITAGTERDFTETAKYIGLNTNIKTIKERIVQEDTIIINALALLDSITKIYSDAKNIVLNVFGQDSLSSFLSSNNINDLLIVRNPAQIKLATNIAGYYQGRISNGIPIETTVGNRYNNIVIADFPRPEEMKAMYSMLAQPDFNEPNAEERMKILSVGIPSSFIKQLADRIDGEQINRTTFTINKQSDIVALNVYKRDNQYSDIVFKPKRYLFDLSLMKDDTAYKLAQPRHTDSFINAVVPRVSLQDISNITNIKSVSLNNLTKDNSYTSRLSSDSIKELVLNHVQSDLLATYISFLSGMNLNEKTFTQTDIVRGQSINSEFTSIIKRYISDFFDESLSSSKTFDEILKDPSVDNQIKDIIRLATFGSLTFEPGVIYEKVIKPKLFDRVFHIPLTVEFFEIDEIETNSTQNGYNALKQDSIQEKLVKFGDRLFMKLNDEEQVVFSDFFVTVETVQ